MTARTQLSGSAVATKLVTRRCDFMVRDFYVFAMSAMSSTFFWYCNNKVLSPATICLNLKSFLDKNHCKSVISRGTDACNCAAPRNAVSVSTSCSSRVPTFWQRYFSRVAINSKKVVLGSFGFWLYTIVPTGLSPYLASAAARSPMRNLCGKLST